MASSGPLNGSVASSTHNAFYNAWTNATNVSAEDGVFATISLGLHAISDLIYVSGFGFSIPAGATINGIVFEVKIKTSASSNGTMWGGAATKDGTTWHAAINNGTSTAGNECAGASLLSTLSWTSMAGLYDANDSTYLWNSTWTPADINSSAFGFRFMCRMNQKGTATFSADAARATVYYTPPPAGGAKSSQCFFE
jgi:hypothetical protein